MIDRNQIMQQLIACITQGTSMREAERQCDVSHSAVSKWLKGSRARDNLFVVDGHYFHESVEAARAAFARAQVAEQEAAVLDEEQVRHDEVDFDPEGEAHAVELLSEAKELGITLNAADPILRNRRAHLSVMAGLSRPQLADAERGTRATLRIDTAGRGQAEPPEDFRMVVSSQRIPYAARIHHGPMALRNAKGEPIK